MAGVAASIKKGAYGKRKTEEFEARSFPYVLIGGDFSIKFKNFGDSIRRNQIKYIFGSDKLADEIDEERARKIIFLNNAAIQKNISKIADEDDKKETLAKYKTLLNILNIEITPPDSYKLMKKDTVEKILAAQRAGNIVAYNELVAEYDELKKNKKISKKIEAMINKEKNVFEDVRVGNILVQKLMDANAIKNVFKSKGVENVLTPEAIDVINTGINKIIYGYSLSIAEAIEKGDPSSVKDKDIARVYEQMINPVGRRAFDKVKVKSRLDDGGKLIKKPQTIIDVDPGFDPELQTAAFLENDKKKKEGPEVRSQLEELAIAIKKD